MEQKIVSRNDCEQIIKKCVASDRFEVVNFKVKPFQDEDREYYKPDCVLEISAKTSKTISRFRFFLKKFYTGYPALNRLLESVRASEREILFYEHFLPALENALQDYQADFAAAYLYGQITRLMVLEDLSLRFFKPAKKANPHLLDRFHVSLALKAVAKLHAASWAYEDKLRDSRLFDERDLLSQEPIWRKDHDCLGKNTIQSGLNGLKTLLKECQKYSELVEERLYDLAEKTFDIMKFQTKYRNVLTHGNLHAKNILFKYDEKHHMVTECALINFGYCRYFLPAQDVLTLIFTSTDRLFRQHYFTYLIKYYYECLHSELMKQELHIDRFITFEDFLQSVNYLMPAIKLQAALHLQDFGAKPGFYQLLQMDEAYLFQDKSFFMRELYKKDPIFKEMALEVLDEVLEVLQEPRVSRENCYAILEERLQTTVYDLRSFALSPVSDNEISFELLLEVAVEDVKEDTPYIYKYSVQCGPDNFFQVQ